MKAFTRDAVTLGTFFTLDTSERDEVYGLNCPDGSNYRLSWRAKTVLQQRWSGKSYADIACELSRRSPAPITAAAVEKFYDLLVGRLEAETTARDKRNAGYLIRIPLLPGPLVDAIASALAPLFGAIPFALIVPAVIAVLGTWLMVERQPQGAQPSAVEYAQGYGLFLLSMLFHELGHAAASRRYGARPSAIGFTLYLMFPALYSDVTATWALSRRQRVAVDLGGTYFQLVVASAYAVADVMEPSRAVHLGLLMILGTALFNLNPLFKFDGYWVLADTLGVTNLSLQVRTIASRCSAALLRREPLDLPWPRSTVAILLLYSLSVLVAWAYFLVFVIAAVGRQMLHGLEIARDALYGGEPLTNESALQLTAAFAGAALALYFLYLRVRFMLRVLKEAKKG